MLKRMLDSLTNSLTTQDPPVAATTAPLMTDHKLGGPYRPLLKRPTSSKGGREEKGGGGRKGESYRPLLKRPTVLWKIFTVELFSFCAIINEIKLHEFFSTTDN